MTKEEINKRLKELLHISDEEFQKLVTEYEKEIVKISGKALKEIKNKIALIYEKLGDDVSYSDMMLYNRLKNLEKSIAEIIKDVTKEHLTNTKEKLSYFFSESFNLTSYSIEKSLGIDLGFGLLKPEVIRAAYINKMSEIKWPESMQEHAQKYMNDIRNELTQGLIEGKGYGKIAAAITDKTSINVNKIFRIVRTEGHRVQNTARIISIEKTEEAAGRLGIKIERVWLATLDNRTRDTHQEMDGQVADENGLFHYPSGGTTPAPGIEGPAEEVINCRCTVITQFKDLPQQFRKDNETKQIIKYKTYEEWKNAQGQNH